MTTNPVASFIKRRPILSIIIFLLGLLWISSFMPPAKEKSDYSYDPNAPYNHEYLDPEWLKAVEEAMFSGGEINITVCESYIGCMDTHVRLSKWLIRETKMKPRVIEIQPNENGTGYVYSYWKFGDIHMYFIYTIEPDGLQSSRLYTSLIPLKY